MAPVAVSAPEAPRLRIPRSYRLRISQGCRRGLLARPPVCISVWPSKQCNVIANPLLSNIGQKQIPDLQFLVLAARPDHRFDGVIFPNIFTTYLASCQSRIGGEFDLSRSPLDPLLLSCAHKQQRPLRKRRVHQQRRACDCHSYVDVVQQKERSERPHHIHQQ